MGHTPFSLIYGSEAMLPTEVEHKSFRVQHFNEERLDDSRINDLTKLEELLVIPDFAGKTKYSSFV
jgi:hypothetical protein